MIYRLLPLLVGVFFCDMKRKVAIQGIGGCNHYIAAKLFFKGDKVDTIDCDTFKELVGHIVEDPSKLGVMAIENTIAGSLLQNYKLLKENDIVIVGEYKLRIKHALVAMPGVEVGDIKEINTHPMAFMQCQEYLDTLPNVKLVEKEDTAGSAKWIKDNNLKDHAAICPAGVAALYGMNVLADGIETNKRNFIPRLQTFCNCFKDSINCQLRISLRQAGLFCYRSNQFGFIHVYFLL